MEINGMNFDDISDVRDILSLLYQLEQKLKLNNDNINLTSDKVTVSFNSISDKFKEIEDIANKFDSLANFNNDLDVELDFQIQNFKRKIEDLQLNMKTFIGGEIDKFMLEDYKSSAANQLEKTIKNLNYEVQKFNVIEKDFTTLKNNLNSHFKSLENSLINSELTRFKISNIVMSFGLGFALASCLFLLLK